MEQPASISEITEPSLPHRVQSVDIVRGLIMVVMALDHVRDFFHLTAFTADPLDPETTTVALYFTRWITHICAPSFLLLSGISANLSGVKSGLRHKANLLCKRGLWLVFVEMAIVTLALSFDITYKVFFLQVIWAIGWSMVLLGLLIRFLPPRTIAVIGLLIIFGHNVMDDVKMTDESALSVLTTFLLTSNGKLYPAGNTDFYVLYAILPWTGIMFLGYGLGELFRQSVDVIRRRKILLALSLGAVLMFLVFRGLNLYGDPIPWKADADTLKTVFSFLNVTKYPPSLAYSLVTLTLTFLLLSLAETGKGALSRILIVFGQIPFFYYIIHFYLIHATSALAVFLSGYTWEQATDPSLLFQFRPSAFGFTLGWVYLVWIAIVLVMYPLSRWFGRYKMTHRHWWLRYL